MRGLIRDLKHALRLYRRTPGASLIALVALTIGMAFVGAFLSMFVDLVLRPHPGFEDSSRIVTIGQTDGARLSGLGLDLIERIADEVASVEHIAGVMTRYQQDGPDSEPRVFELVTDDFFEGLRPKLTIGRGFETADHTPDSEPVAVISYAFWQQEFGGDVEVLGTTYELETQGNTRIGPDGQLQQAEPETTEFRIVGVMAAGMKGVSGPIDVTMWIPFERAIGLYYDESQLSAVRRSLSLRTFARRADGASAAAIARQINKRYENQSAEFNLQAGMRIDAIKGVVLNLTTQRDIRRQLRLFLAGSILLALVAACNVSLFLLARAPGRRRELAIRLAVGAPMKRLGRQLATEAGVLVIVSALFGIALSVWLSAYLRSLAFLRQAEWGNVTLLDWRVLSLVGAVLLLLTLLVSLAPVLGLKRLGIAVASRQVAARATLAQRIAGAAQVAIAGTFAGAAIAFAWYLGVLMFGHPGYETRNLHAAELGMDFAAMMNRSRGSPEAMIVENERRRDAFAGLPGVTDVAFGSPIPGLGGRSWSTMPHPLDPTRQIRVNRGTLDARYVDVLGLRLIHGRAPTDNDVAVALVNQTLAREFWGREDVVGESLPTSIMGGSSTEVIGVLEDLSFEHPNADIEPTVFLTSNTSFFFNIFALLESSLSSGELEQQIRELTDSGALEMSLNRVVSMKEVRASVIAADRARGLLTILTAALVVFLAALGFYGTQRYLVTAGRREYAIRASLGAGPRALGRLVFVRGLLLSLPGLVIGALGAFMLVAWLRDDYVSRDISPFLVTAGVVAGLVLLLLGASFGPARQARRTQPAPLLREE